MLQPADCRSKIANHARGLSLEDFWKDAPLERMALKWRRGRLRMRSDVPRSGPLTLDVHRDLPGRDPDRAAQKRFREADTEPNVTSDGDLPCSTRLEFSG